MSWERSGRGTRISETFAIRLLQCSVVCVCQEGAGRIKKQKRSECRLGVRASARPQALPLPGPRAPETLLAGKAVPPQPGPCLGPEPGTGSLGAAQLWQGGSGGGRGRRIDAPNALRSPVSTASSVGGGRCRVCNILPAPFPSVSVGSHASIAERGWMRRLISIYRFRSEAWIKYAFVAQICPVVSRLTESRVREDTWRPTYRLLVVVVGKPGRGLA